MCEPRRPGHRIANSILTAILLPLSFVPSAYADDPRASGAAESTAIRGVRKSAPVSAFLFDGDVRDLPVEPVWQPGDPVREIPMRHYFPGGAEPTSTAVPGMDPLVAAQLLAAAQPTRGAFTFTVPTRNFPGQSYTGGSPPDTVGDVGPDHFVQVVNALLGADVRIWDKATPTPNLLATFRLDNLGNGPCADGLGDADVVYDRQADRWVILEIEGSGSRVCVYVSQGADPVSDGWYYYGPTTTSFADYPKIAVWATDANDGQGSYVVTANDDGPGVIAFDRGAMLSGQPMTSQRLELPPLVGFTIQGHAPAEPDGPTAPPPGAPAIVMRHRDTELHGGPPVAGDLLEMWLLDVDWNDPGNTTLTQAADIEVADFDSTVCGTGFEGCFDQPGSMIDLMPLREVIMNRLQYYDHGDGETLVGNFVVDVNGADRGGIRWFELRRDPGGPWALHQEGTYSIDTHNRWMGAIAMDQSRNIALAYSISSKTVFPSLRYTGRQAADPTGVMTQLESVIHAGTAANSSLRNGDYAAMALDPDDDCTFWFTGMDNTSGDWRTQVASFRFDDCGCQLPITPPQIDATAGADNQIDLFWNDADQPTVVEYEIKRSRVPGGPYELIAVVADSSPDMAGGPGYAYVDDGVAGGVPYYYVLVANDGALCSSQAVNEVGAVPTGACTLPPVFSGVGSAGSAAFDTCRSDVSWNAAVPVCGGPVVYNVYRSTVPGFVPGMATLLVSGIGSTSIADVNDLADDTTVYYLVRSVDLSNGFEDPNVVEAAVEVSGPGSGQQLLLDEDFEAPDSFDDWSVLTGPGPHNCGDWSRSDVGEQRPDGGGGFYARSLSRECLPLLPLTSTSMDSPALDVAFPSIQSVNLDVDLYFVPENPVSVEDGTVEAWDGSSWHTIWIDSNQEIDGHLVLDVTPYAAGNPAFRVRFNYQDANDAEWYSFDNVRVSALVDTACTTAPDPAPAPDGRGGSLPLRADRVDPAGTEIAITWDAVCGATNYNLLYGDLSTVASYSLTGSHCAIGAVGSFSWSDPPAGDSYFLIVGTDGVATESSWGEGTSGERHGLSPSGECGVTAKNISGVCP